MKPFDFYLIRKVNGKKICRCWLNLVCGVSVAVCLMVNERDDALFPKIFKLKSSLNCCLLVCQGRRPSILNALHGIHLSTLTHPSKRHSEKRGNKNGIIWKKLLMGAQSWWWWWPQSRWYLLSLPLEFTEKCILVPGDPQFNHSTKTPPVKYHVCMGSSKF